DLDRAMVRCVAISLAMVSLISGPIYLRNAYLTGSPVPMTRDLEPMRGAESNMVLRPRRITDYLDLNLDCFLHPSIFDDAQGTPSFGRRNPAMSSVWGLTYASLWYDPFVARTPLFLRPGLRLLPLGLMLLGIVPTAAAVVGFIASLTALLRSAGR